MSISCDLRCFLGIILPSKFFLPVALSLGDLLPPKGLGERPERLPTDLLPLLPVLFECKVMCVYVLRENMFLFYVCIMDKVRSHLIDGIDVAGDGIDVAGAPRILLTLGFLPVLSVLAGLSLNGCGPLYTHCVLCEILSCF